MIKNFTKLTILCLIVGTSFSACKKDSNKKNTDNGSSTYSMNFTLNGSAVAYTTCSVIDVQANNNHYIQFVGLNKKSPNNYLQIEIVADTSNLKVGQSFEVTGDLLGVNTAIFFYSIDDNNKFSTLTAFPSGIVTITSVSSTTIKGTFSAKLYSVDNNGATLKYTVTNGTFVGEMPK